MRLRREFLTYARSCGDLWIATGEEIVVNDQLHEAAAMRSA
jgi:hypothetical protein